MKTIYKPSYQNQQRCLSLRRITKQGGLISKKDSGFCLKIIKKYPEWYKATEAIIFNETVPYGSNARQAVDTELIASMVEES